MTSSEISSLTVARVRQGLAGREFSAVELAQEALRFAEAENPKTNAYLHFSPERALAAARRVDEKLGRGEDAGVLAGVPVAVKDVILTEGVLTTCGSKLLANYVAPYDATAIISLEAAGGVILGKTNCDEFAMGSSTENSAFGPVRNPVAPDRVPGGSSGGSAAVTAQGTAVLALGSDTGGSIRQPASFCGVVGVTPTYGRVSRYGLTAFASSLDHIGPFARNVRDAALLLQVIAGRDPNDATSAFAPIPDYTAALDGEVRGLKVGLPREYFQGLASETGDRIAKGVETLKRLGCEVREISLPHTEYAIGCYYIICTAEASSNLARYDGVRYTMRSPRSETLSDMYRNTRGEGFGAECKRRIMLGTYVLSAGYYDAYYLKAQKVRTLIARDFSQAFEQVDAIVTPVSPFPAFKLGEKLDDPLEMYLSDIYTITGDLAGIPCMSVPCGRTSAGLPVGMQILANHFNEAGMFRLAGAFEAAGGFEG
ncbi:MAG TPA: Asp-tRNA(Asn)/Glu-tRNA(Gln) amidotransferase subunit GatA [Bryobacteraceae bacterium]|jgi:aspartyl-tRNA(Asn)/glutamyl-tRNA(Gln) amidotransferase subunit A|nr:Asp-tRNA(Asn)/Glu-tRNA(Gln) amidotransferase subunit GatA [Bryobacteraceae bacterium]